MSKLQLAENRVALRLTTKHAAFRAFRDGAALLNDTCVPFTIFLGDDGPYDRPAIGKLRDRAIEMEERFLDAAAEYLGSK